MLLPRHPHQQLHRSTPTQSQSCTDNSGKVIDHQGKVPTEYTQTEHTRASLITAGQQVSNACVFYVTPILCGGCVSM
jgi:hypothetical protein